MSLWSRWPSPLQPGTQCRSTWESWGVTICANQGTAGRVLVPLLAARPFHVWSKTSRTGEKETRGQEHFPSKTCRQVNRDKRDKLGSRRPRFQNSAGVTATSCPPSGPWLRREPVDRPGRAPASPPPPPRASLPPPRPRALRRVCASLASTCVSLAETTSLRPLPAEPLLGAPRHRPAAGRPATPSLH